METPYYQQFQRPHDPKTAKEKGVRARGAEDKELVSAFKPESVA
jgi:hypothetical protein